MAVYLFIYCSGNKPKYLEPNQENYVLIRQYFTSFRNHSLTKLLALKRKYRPCNPLLTKKPLIHTIGVESYLITQKLLREELVLLFRKHFKNCLNFNECLKHLPQKCAIFNVGIFKNFLAHQILNILAVQLVIQYVIRMILGFLQRQSHMLKC